ncbi:hypothetical protein M404DRAFT_1003658 [Pisolithus tinctorius Marx 270]|uniref:Uncharacterized protein n=1 Tax=Pisolithus tinctorius Marx 270 TaxID=870435 RepID=A0A0C3NZD7_PISTI|nr:hypothetical protein M404DRAFT_1003658 [Pisolithus tinctorius Marx 270]
MTYKLSPQTYSLPLVRSQLIVCLPSPTPTFLVCGLYGPNQIYTSSESIQYRKSTRLGM